MAFNTKLKLIDAKFEQVSGATLTLSGNTIIADSGELKYTTHPTFSEDTQIIDKKYVDDNIVSGVTGGTIYSLESPSVLEVGGLVSGSVLTGRTANEILQDILVPELFGTLSNSSAFISRTPASPSIYEVGTIIGTLTISGGANRGGINPQYESDSQFRSGLPNLYTFAGPSVGAAQATSAMSANDEISNYAVTLGAQSWNVQIAYDAGLQPKGSKGTPFNSPAGAVTRTSPNTSMTGYYPVFYGTSATKPTAGQALLSSSTSKLIIASTGNLTINFGSTGGAFMWFAVPSASSEKTRWVENGNPVNTGPIAATELFETPILVVDIDSPELTPLWTNIDYNFYIGGFSGNLLTYILSNS